MFGLTIIIMDRVNWIFNRSRVVAYRIFFLRGGGGPLRVYGTV